MPIRCRGRHQNPNCFATYCSVASPSISSQEENFVVAATWALNGASGIDSNSSEVSAWKPPASINSSKEEKEVYFRINEGVNRSEKGISCLPFSFLAARSICLSCFFSIQYIDFCHWIWYNYPRRATVFCPDFDGKKVQSCLNSRLKGLMNCICSIQYTGRRVRKLEKFFPDMDQDTLFKRSDDQGT